MPLAAESAGGLTLKRAGVPEESILRQNIARLTSLPQSLMPEGLEGGLNLQDMADLIEFLVNPGK